MKEGQNDEGNSVQGAYSYFVRLLQIGSTKRERSVVVDGEHGNLWCFSFPKTKMNAFRIKTKCSPHLVRPEEEVELPRLGVHGQPAHEEGPNLEERKRK